ELVGLADRARRERGPPRRIAFDARARERRLVARRIEHDRFLGPAPQQHVDALLEDLAVLAVCLALVGDGRDRAGVLAEHVRPARLVAAREADPVAALEQ